jgi:hypothetical protein
MKKRLSLLLAIAMLVSVFCMTGAAAASENIGSKVLTVKYNGEAVIFPDAQPFVDQNNRTLIPVRFVAETMGAAVSWDQAAQTAVIEQNGITVSVPIGSDTLSVVRNGSTDTVKMDTAAIIRDERTYVPIRFVAEAVGAWVGYSNLFTTVQIYRDVLTPEEITRLHGYCDMSSGEYDKATGETPLYTDEFLLTLYPEFAYFTGSYGFENANEWKLRNPNGSDTLIYTWKKPVTYTGITTGDTYTFGTQPDLDFTKLILAEAHGVVDELNAQGKVSISLRTDLSCVFWSRHSSNAGTYVRGVLTVTIPENADTTWIKRNYDFISNPKAGETRNVDVEIYVNTFTETVYWNEMTALT